MEGAKEQFTKWGILFASLGMAIGTGNIWRFPRVVARNGGGSFLIPWVLFLFLWSIPLLMIEFGWGRRSRVGPVKAFSEYLGRKFTWMGGFIVWCTLFIMFYYSVVTGWCIKYFLAILYDYEKLLKAPSFYFSQFQGSLEAILFHVLAMGSCAFVIIKGVNKGIEVANKILLPSLLFIFIIALIRVLTLDGATKGIEFLFSIRVEYLTKASTWLEALSQSAWSTGAGWGLIFTYASYTSKKEDAHSLVMTTGFGDNSFSLIAGMVILPAVFALSTTVGVEPSQVLNSTNEGLAFIWIPTLLSNLPIGGRLFSFLFFVAFFFAAFSSLISMVELGTKFFVDMGHSRTRACGIIVILGVLMGIPSALFPNLLHNQDWVWGLGLILSGFFLIISVIKYGVNRFREEFLVDPFNSYNPGRWFNYFILFFWPLEFIAIIGWWFFQAISWSSNENPWWSITSTFSIGTCLFQWSILLIFLLIFNNYIYTKSIRS